MSIHKTKVVLDTAAMTPLSFWVTDVNDQDVASIIRQELKLAQNQKQYAMRPSNGKLCLGDRLHSFENISLHLGF